MYTAKQRFNEANLDEQTTCWNIMTQKNSRGTTQKPHGSFSLGKRFLRLNKPLDGGVCCCL